MKSGLIITIIISGLILSSCATKYPHYITAKPLSSVDHQLLDGTFTNNAVSHHLWAHLTNDTAAHTNCKVKLQTINKHTVEAQLISDQKIIRKLTLKGRFKNNSFIVRGQTSARFPIFIAIWVLSTNNNRLSITPQNQLWVDNVKSGAVFCLIMPLGAADNYNFDIKYDRIAD